MARSFFSLSRRQVLKTAACLPTLATAAAPPILAYVGTYSSPQGPEGSKGNGQGILLFQMDPATGRLDKRDLFEDASNPSWLALHPSKNFLYAANEVSNLTVPAPVLLALMASVALLEV